MSESFWGVAIIMAGLIGLAFIMLFQDITTTNDKDYYLLKEVTEAAMIDAVDLDDYQLTGTPKIIKEKFVENFLRRFAESVGSANLKEYQIDFYDISVEPPKVSVRVSAKGTTFNVTGDTFDIVNQLDAIIETKY